MATIFISHSSKDEAEARRLKAWLEARGFEGIFLDFDQYDGIPPGADWEKKLYREIERAAAVLLVLTKNWFASKWCFVEFAQARALGKAIYPLIETPQGETLVAPDIQHLDLTRDRDGGLDRLARSLTEVVVNAQGGFEWDRSRSPFPGLNAFEASDAAIYFGRDDDIRRLIERLNARRAQGGEKLVVLLGASGSGKSSLMRAGVLPRLARDKANWIALPPFRPQRDPVGQLALAIASALGDSDWRLWRERLRSREAARELRDLAKDLRQRRGANEASVLISVDQGEELFGISEPVEAERFLYLLRILAEDDIPFIVLLGMRSDYLGEWQKAAPPAFEQVSLEPMKIERVRQIIEGPAKVAGISVDDALIVAAMKDAGVDDALPLLAFAMRELHDRHGGDGHLTLAEYESFGDPVAGLSSLENAVRRRADETLATARSTPDDLTALREALIPDAVQVNTQGEYVRQPALIDGMPPRALPLIERLVAARLLTIALVDAGKQVEVAHEALLRKWPLLRGWLDEERDFIIGLAQLKRDAADWSNAPEENKKDALLTGLKLTRARGWLATHGRHLKNEERVFVLASVRESEAEGLRRETERAEREKLKTRLLSGAVAAAIVAMLIAGVAGWQWDRAQKLAAAEVAQREIAQTRESQLLARQAREQLSFGNPMTAVQLALRGLPSTNERPWVAETYGVLLEAFGLPQERRSFAAHDEEEPVLSAAFSPDGRRVLTASGDYTARLWEVAPGKEPVVLRGHEGYVRWAAFSPDGAHLVTASADGTARIWETSSGKELRVLRGHEDSVESAIFSPDGTRVLTASKDQTARIWIATSGMPVAVMRGHLGNVRTAVFDQNSVRVLTASSDRTARVWEAVSGRQIAVLRGHESGLNSAVFSPNGARVLTASLDKTARLWETAAGRPLAVLRGHEDMVLTAVFDPNGVRVLTASADKTARLWEANSGKQLATLRGHENTLSTAVFSPDGTRLLTASDDKTARLWEPLSGKQIVIFRGHSKALTSAVFSPDGLSVLTASFDTTARLWGAATSKESASLQGHKEPVITAVFSPDDTRILTASDDKTARLWEAPAGKELIVLQGHQDRVSSAVFSPDSTRILTASDDKTARLWEGSSGKELIVLRGHQDRVSSAVFSPDGTRILTASFDTTARLWESLTGKETTVLHGHEEVVFSAVFSPNSARILTASDDKTARLWEVSSGKEIAVLQGHEEGVSSVVFSSDSARALTASIDKTVRLWELSVGKQVAVFRGHEGWVESAAFSHDSTHILTSSKDGTARIIWIGKSPQEVLDYVRAALPRDLSPEEERKFYLSAGSAN